MPITSNVREILARNRARAVAMRREQGAAARVIAPELERESKRILGAKVYSVRIPASRTGRPLWDRSGELLAAEKAVADGVNVRLTNSSPHAKPRNDLGLAGHRKPKYTASVQWQAEAVAAKRAWIVSVRRAAQVRALKG